MKSLIKQLPDRIANQIAAGEVIQRPASIIKELLENSVDAGATDITMIVKDAGKELIQVIDNGKGMSPVDARLCFERHATSKIETIEDLFSVRTMGFRGEALASIAAVSQVELITKTIDDEVATQVVIEGGNFREQNPISSIEGTNIMVKNLFYNVPARRKFLKSNNAEWRHIYEEYVRVALAYPQVSFKLMHNGSEQLNLPAGVLKNRVVDIMGNRFDKYLIPVKEDTDYLKVTGYIGKPEVATRSKANQFLFINNRFIKSPYIHHAIVSAYEGLITAEEQPVYCLYFDIAPERIDINVHPTKQEVKFEDERMVYSFVKSMLKHVLAKFNISPSIDFSISSEYSQLESFNRPINDQDISRVENSFIKKSFSQPNRAHFIDSHHNESFFAPQNHIEMVQSLKSQLSKDNDEPIQSKINLDSKETSTTPEEKGNTQEGLADVLIWKDYVVSSSKSGLLLVHMHRAQERIVYDQLLNRYLYNTNIQSQQLLYPEMIELSHLDTSYLNDMFEELKKIGFEVSSMGGNSYAIHGVPAEMTQLDIKSVFEEIIEAFKYSDDKNVNAGIDNAMKTAARRASKSKINSKEEVQALLAQLFSCPQPEYTPHGQKIIKILPLSDIENLF